MYPQAARYQKMAISVCSRGVLPLDGVADIFDVTNMVELDDLCALVSRMDLCTCRSDVDDFRVWVEGLAEQFVHLTVTDFRGETYNRIISAKVVRTADLITIALSVLYGRSIGDYRPPAQQIAYSLPFIRTLGCMISEKLVVSKPHWFHIESQKLFHLMGRSMNPVKASSMTCMGSMLRVISPSSPFMHLLLYSAMVFCMSRASIAVPTLVYWRRMTELLRSTSSLTSHTLYPARTTVVDDLLVKTVAVIKDNLPSISKCCFRWTDEKGLGPVVRILGDLFADTEKLFGGMEEWLEHSLESPAWSSTDGDFVRWMSCSYTRIHHRQAVNMLSVFHSHDEIDYVKGLSTGPVECLVLPVAAWEFMYQTAKILGLEGQEINVSIKELVRFQSRDLVSCLVCAEEGLLTCVSALSYFHLHARFSLEQSIELVPGLVMVVPKDETGDCVTDVLNTVDNMPRVAPEMIADMMALAILAAPTRGVLASLLRNMTHNRISVKTSTEIAFIVSYLCMGLLSIMSRLMKQETGYDVRPTVRMSGDSLACILHLACRGMHRDIAEQCREERLAVKILHEACDIADKHGILREYQPRWPRKWEGASLDWLKKASLDVTRNGCIGKFVSNEKQALFMFAVLRMFVASYTLIGGTTSSATAPPLYPLSQTMPCLQLQFSETTVLYPCMWFALKHMSSGLFEDDSERKEKAHNGVHTEPVPPSYGYTEASPNDVLFRVTPPHSGNYRTSGSASLGSSPSKRRRVEVDDHDPLNRLTDHLVGV